MAIEQEELQRRLVAARELCGLDQKGMGAKLKAAGLGRTDAMRLERGTIPLSDAHLDAYARITGLPIQWFLIEDVVALFAPTLRADKRDTPPPVNPHGEEAARLLLAALDNVRAALGEEQFNKIIETAYETGTPPMPADPPSESAHLTAAEDAADELAPSDDDADAEPGHNSGPRG